MTKITPQERVAAAARIADRRAYAAHLAKAYPTANLTPPKRAPRRPPAPKDARIAAREE